MSKLKALFIKDKEESSREKKKDRKCKKKRNAYKTWGSYFTETLHIQQAYAYKRIRIYEVFTREELSDASLDFSAAVHLISLSITNRKYWLQQAKERVVSMHDIKTLDVDRDSMQPASENSGEESSSKCSRNEHRSIGERISEKNSSEVEDSNKEETSNSSSSTREFSGRTLRASKRQPPIRQNNRYDVIAATVLLY